MSEMGLAEATKAAKNRRTISISRKDTMSAFQLFSSFSRNDVPVPVLDGEEDCHARYKRGFAFCCSGGAWRRRGDEDRLCKTYLFVLCMERLGHLIDREVSSGRWKPVQLGRGVVQAHPFSLFSLCVHFSPFPIDRDSVQSPIEGEPMKKEGITIGEQALRIVCTAVPGLKASLRCIFLLTISSIRDYSIFSITLTLDSPSSSSIGKAVSFARSLRSSSPLLLSAFACSPADIKSSANKVSYGASLEKGRLGFQSAIGPPKRTISLATMESPVPSFHSYPWQVPDSLLTLEEGEQSETQGPTNLAKLSFVRKLAKSTLGVVGIRFNTRNAEEGSLDQKSGGLIYPTISFQKSSERKGSKRVEFTSCRSSVLKKEAHAISFCIH
ncbi:flavanone 3-dioxygenase [Striga asiatica]|uniref:Flavanone 3-dioxygenase n=1 Tax=Striga asiatica TaxID=4170 RepID=A0A5A7QJZ2_STRAF|nr:flavanone 3-dioxygenase [Striga asiatica]